MSADPQVSIIIPTRDRPGLLARSVASALSQRGAASIEIVVVDDGSDPPAAPEPDPAVRLIRTENQGAAAARNIGLERARGTHVLFLDSDDWLEPDAIANLLRALKDTRASVAFGAWRNVFASGEGKVVGLSTPYADGLANALAGGWVTGSFLMSRAIAARFEPSLKTWEITTFLCASLAQASRVATCADVVVNVAQHDDPQRVSIRHDHFEPAATARAFEAMKAMLAARGGLNDDRLAALDGKLLACLSLLLRARRSEAAEVYASIDWSRVPLQAAYRPASFSWCARWGGLAGAKGFVILRQALEPLAGFARAPAA